MPKVRWLTFCHTQGGDDLATLCSHNARTEKGASSFSYSVKVEKRARSDHPLRRVTAAIEFALSRRKV
jgi:hypothetical protein